MFPASQIVNGEPVVTGEATPYYFFCPLAPGRASALLPEARLILLLRDPVDRAYSHYRHARKSGHEPLQTFEEAIAAEPGRLSGEEERIIAGGGPSSAHQRYSYVTRGYYALQLERWLKFYPLENFLILRSEDLYRDPRAVSVQVQGFLGLPYADMTSHSEEFSRNATTGESLRPDTRRRLREHFAPHNARLDELLGYSFFNYPG